MVILMLVASGAVEKDADEHLAGIRRFIVLRQGTSERLGAELTQAVFGEGVGEVLVMLSAGGKQPRRCSIAALWAAMDFSGISWPFD